MIEENGWKVEVQCEPRSSHPGTTARWLSSLQPPKFTSMKREDCHSTVWVPFMSSPLPNL